MTASAPGSVMPFLRRAGLLAGILALVAGILGMHTMPGFHSMPAATPAVGTALQVQGPTVGHSGHSADWIAVPEASTMAGTAAVAWSGCGCTDPDGCTTMSAMGAACTPSLGNAFLAAPAPGTAALGAHDLGTATDATASYFYLPAGPSPGELSISRT
ncbi:MAG TPA: hypothetical protein VFD99_00540 [Arthrobacter sp.]|jgi:hypothetical protein|nr:hypothetical protein [Arthrobacter sp.]